jgi:hypothetical protein
MKLNLKLVAVATALTLSHSASTLAADLGEETRQELRLTLYSNGLALINDQRKVDLKSGINTLNLSDISPKMVEDSARIVASTPLVISEQGYLAHNLSHQELMKAYVGRSVKFATVNPETGEDIIRDAELISVNNGPIVRIGDSIETTLPGRILFPAIPAYLRANPLFQVTGTSSAAGPAVVGLTYLSNGFLWSANHTLSLNSDGSSLKLETWATLANTSGLTINNAAVQVIAGTVKRRSPQTSRLKRGNMQMMAAAPMMDAEMAAPVRQSVGGFHLYTLPGTYTLEDGNNKQISLLRTLSLPVKRTLVSETHANIFSPARGPVQPTHPLIRLSLSNDKTAGPGQPIPGGIARVYGKDAEGRTQFLGEDQLQDLPIGAKTSISIGKSFDVTVRRQQTDYVREGLGRNTSEAAFRITITNGNDKTEEVEIVENMNGDWTVREESAPHQRANNRAKWTVSVPAKGNAEITYRVRTRR